MKANTSKIAKLVKVENKKQFTSRGNVLGVVLMNLGLTVDSTNKKLDGANYYEFLVSKKDNLQVGVLPTSKRFAIK